MKSTLICVIKSKHQSNDLFVKDKHMSSFVDHFHFIFVELYPSSSIKQLPIKLFKYTHTLKYANLRNQYFLFVQFHFFHSIANSRLILGQT